MKLIISLCWIVTMPIAILKVSYDIALAYIEFRVDESFKKH